MGILYDANARKWNITYEKTDYPTDLPTNLKTDYTALEFAQLQLQSGGGYGGKFPYLLGTTSTSTSFPYSSVQELNAANTQTNQQNQTLNQQNQTLNQQNTLKNAAYDRTVALAGSAAPGTYLNLRSQLRSFNAPSDVIKSIENNFKTFYLTEKIQQWDSALGAQPPYGTFDASYYKQQNPGVSQQWSAAVANDDLDIISRYNENSYYLYHYTTQGKPAGFRGNQAEDLAASRQYVETKPTDAELAQVRQLQLGVDTNTLTDRFLSIPEISSAWEKAKAGDIYWKEQAQKFYLDLQKPDEFAALFRLSDRPEDKNIVFKYNLNSGAGITETEDVLNVAVGEKAIVDVKKFGALTQDVLKQTIEEMKKAKGREQELALYSGLDAFKEVIDLNKTLAQDMFADSGLGGVFSFAGGNQGQQDLEKALQNVTGVNNSTIYNWQQWFDDTLKKRYQTDLELGYSSQQSTEKVKVEGAFARNFIDQYLVPRFNESRSMNEFIDYVDVKEGEQNPFQTQDLLNAAKMVADIRANQYIDQLRKTPDRYFDSNFYFNPTGNKAREGAYAQQAQTVNADWQAAKAGDPYWKQQAYRFGVDINNKDAFARMHFQVKGQGQGYDSADDILNASKVSDYIYNQVLPAIKQEVAKQGTIFGQFIRPEEFADEVVKGLDPNNKDTWSKALESLGLGDFKGTVDDLKSYIAQTVQTGSAQDIRQQIAYLNKIKERPTQELLGATYIQRPEDYRPTTTLSGETEFYKVFQKAGYQGTEDEFYESFFPDVDRTEQTVLTKAGKGTAFTMSGFAMNDPFKSLSSLQSFFGEEDDEEDKVPAEESYFTIDKDTTVLPKSKAAESFLGEFTSLFKGFG